MSRFTHVTPKVAVIGGGIAGSVISLRLAEQGVDTSLFERHSRLVSGPPFCHLHAGGSFYRNISDRQCFNLLQDSVKTLSAFPNCANPRPTVIATPKDDPGSPEDLIPRLEKLRERYRELSINAACETLGQPDDYFHLFYENDLRILSTQALPKKITSLKEWMIPVAKELDFEQIKFPIILVQEHGLSTLRFAATATLAANQLPRCHIYLNTDILEMSHGENSKCKLNILDKKANKIVLSEFDYVVNACGFQSGKIDDSLSLQRSRMLEFKAAYITKWVGIPGIWPEVVFHGERGTPNGMAQLTPYPDGFFQLHGMTNEITLFDGGLVNSSQSSAQPKLPQALADIIHNGWPDHLAEERTNKAIDHVAKFIPSFSKAEQAAHPWHGAQQIPGDDPNLRATEVSFVGANYARAEIVKACSAVVAAESISNKLKELGFCPKAPEKEKPAFSTINDIPEQDVQELAEALAKERGYPAALAQK